MYSPVIEITEPLGNYDQNVKGMLKTRSTMLESLLIKSRPKEPGHNRQSEPHQKALGINMDYFYSGDYSNPQHL